MIEISILYMYNNHADWNQPEFQKKIGCQR